MQRNNSCFNPISRRVPPKLGYCLHAWNKYVHWVVSGKASCINWILNKYCCLMYIRTHTLPLSCSYQYNNKHFWVMSISACACICIWHAPLIQKFPCSSAITCDMHFEFRAQIQHYFYIIKLFSAEIIEQTR